MELKINGNGVIYLMEIFLIKISTNIIIISICIIKNIQQMKMKNKNKQELKDRERVREM